MGEGEKRGQRGVSQIAAQKRRIGAANSRAGGAAYGAQAT